MLPVRFASNLTARTGAQVASSSALCGSRLELKTRGASHVTRFSSIRSVKQRIITKCTTLRLFSTEATQSGGHAAKPDAHDAERQPQSMLNFNEVISRVGEKEYNMVDYIPEAFAYVLLFEEDGISGAEWFAELLMKYPHRASEWMRLMWFYLLSDAPHYAPQGVEITDAYIEHRISFVLYACRMAWKNQHVRDWVWRFCDTKGVHDTYPTAWKEARAMLDADVDHEWHIIGNLPPRVVLELNESTTSSEEKPIDTTTFHRWVMCQWARYFATHSTTALKNLLEAAAFEYMSDPDLSGASEQKQDNHKARLKLARSTLTSLCFVSYQRPHALKNLKTLAGSIQTSTGSQEINPVSDQRAQMSALNHVFSFVDGLIKQYGAYDFEKGLRLAQEKKILLLNICGMQPNKFDSRIKLSDWVLLDYYEKLVHEGKIPEELRNKEALMAKLRSTSTSDLRELFEKWNVAAGHPQPRFSSEAEEQRCKKEINEAMCMFAVGIEAVRGSPAFCQFASHIYQMGLYLQLPLSWMEGQPNSLIFARRVLDFNRSDPAAWRMYATILAVTRDDETVTAFQKAVELGDVKANFQLAVELALRGETAEALKAAERFPTPVGDAEIKTRLIDRIKSGTLKWQSRTVSK